MAFCGRCGTKLPSLCPSCGSANPEGFAFCGQCGARLAEAPAPTPQGPPAFASARSYTPKHLAEKILTSKTALEGERKHVTVLFADLKGSMELLADRDPEEAQQVLDPVLEHMMEAVHQYEGTVNQVMGDGIMALFGAPVAHEDHAVRACYAALRMQESVKRYADEAFRSHGVPVQIRVGLNSGEVVVRAISSDLHMDYSAIGQTTHLAARVEQMAQPGTILVTPEVVALAEGFVQVTSRGAVPVKGLRTPIEVFELGGASPVRNRLHAAAARGLTRFVGRDAELAILRQALGRASEGHGQIVAVVGDPGVGKSRLIWEFTHSHRRQGCLVLEAASMSYGTATTYFPVVELLRRYFGIEPRDDGRKMREKVTGRLLSLDHALEAALPAFLSLLDVPVEDPEWTRLNPPQRRRLTLEALKRLVLRESQIQPVLLVVEDLHWIDSETQAWLDLLVESVPTARLLLLTNYRPEYAHGWGSKTYYQEVRLDALPTATAEELLEALLGAAPGLDDLRQLLIDRTQGNPFFLEESVRALVETRALTGERGVYRLAGPIQSLQLPATAQAILAARIDRLGLSDKRLLQAVAVVGKDVPLALLLAIAEDPEESVRQGLARLQAAGFLYEARLFPDLEYTFKHALTHEVTYGSLLQERRRDLHARLVDTIETLHQDRAGEEVERLARHALLGEVWEKAVPYLKQAGVKSAARSALPEARSRFDQALGVLEGLPESQATLEQGFDIRLELPAVLTQLGEARKTLDRLNEAEALAERLHDDRRRGRVAALMTNAHTVLGELDEALVTGSRALEIAGRLGDLRLRILATTYLEQAHYYQAEYARVVQLATSNLAALPTEWVYEYLGAASPPSIYDRCRLVMSLSELGRFAEAAEHGAEAVRLAEPTRHPHTIGWASYAVATLHHLKGDWPKARLAIDHSIAALRTGNVALLLPYVVASSAWIVAELGDASEALSRLREGERLLAHRDMREIGTLGRAYHWLGRASLRLGQPDEARRLANCAVESVSSGPGHAAHALQLLGDIAIHPDRFDAENGETHYRQALALAEPRNMRPLIAHCHFGLGKLFRRTGERAQALEHLTTATTMYREMDMGFWLEQAEAEMKELGTRGSA